MKSTEADQFAVVEANHGFGFTPIGEIKVKRLSWWIDQWMPKAGIVFVSAYAKGGKSTFLTFMNLKLTTGEALFGEFKTRPCTVLYYCLEDHKGEMRERVKRMLKGKRFPRKFLISYADAVILPKDIKKIESDLLASKADVIEIDALRRSHGEEENSSTEMAGVLNGIRALVQRHKKTFVIVHHAGNEVLKASEAEKDIAKTWLRGTSDLPANYDVLIALDRKKDDSVVVRVFHKYRSHLPKMLYTPIKSAEIDPVTNDYFITDLVLNKGYLSDLDTKDEALIEQTLLKSPGLAESGNGLVQKLRGKLSRPRIDAALQRMHTKKVVTSVGKGRNCRWQLIRPSDEMNDKTESSGLLK